MGSWLGIVVAPLVMLGYLSAAYALVPWACATQQHRVLDLLALVALAMTLAAVGFGWREWRRPHAGAGAARAAFLGAIAVGVATLSALAVAAQWATRLALSPCVS